MGDAAHDAAAAAPALDARPALGGRDTDERGVNAGYLRCPRCFSRLVSTCGELKERQGSEACLWVPKHRQPAATQPTADAEAAESAARCQIAQGDRE